MSLRNLRRLGNLVFFDTIANFLNLTKFPKFSLTKHYTTLYDPIQEYRESPAAVAELSFIGIFPLSISRESRAS